VQDKEYACGINTVRQLVERKGVIAVYFKQPAGSARLRELADAAKQQKIACYFLTPDSFAKFKLQNHQGVVAVLKAKQEMSLSDLITKLDEKQTAPLILALDCVQDPNNLGAIMRSAEAAKIDALIIPKDKSASLNATVRKVASGAADMLNVLTVTNLARTLQQLKEHGFWVYGCGCADDKPIYNHSYHGSTVIVMGSEGTGLRSLTRKCCDELLGIPMYGNINSLNVSVAAGIVLMHAAFSRGH